MRKKLSAECFNSQKMQLRDRLVLEFWDRSRNLSLKNRRYRNYAKKFFLNLLRQDIGNGDLTTGSLIENNKIISANITAKENGILAGLEEFSLVNKDLKLKFLKKDGDSVNKGDILIEIHGNAKKILERERTSLNLLQRMSGIATLTNTLNKKLNNKARIAATRKTAWGLIDKKAVSTGGGLTHRLNLNDGILIKDNHLKILGHDIEKALALVKSKSGYIEIEVESKNQALESAKAIKNIKKSFIHDKTFFAIMLDKIPPKEIKSIIKRLKKQNLYDYMLLEASGNISPDNLMDYAGCGIDVISMGCITNAAGVLDLSQEITAD